MEHTVIVKKTNIKNNICQLINVKIASRKNLLFFQFVFLVLENCKGGDANMILQNNQSNFEYLLNQEVTAK